MNLYALRVSNHSDLEECASWVQDSVPIFSTWRLPPIGQDTLFIPKQIISSDVSLSAYNENIHIGNVALLDVDFKSRSCDIAIILSKDVDFKSVFSLIASLCFKTLGLNRVQLQTFLENPISNQCKDLGLHLDGILREHGFENGIFKDVHLWSLISREFDERFSDEL